MQTTVTFAHPAILQTSVSKFQMKEHDNPTG